MSRRSPTQSRVGVTVADHTPGSWEACVEKSTLPSSLYYGTICLLYAGLGDDEYVSVITGNGNRADGWCAEADVIPMMRANAHLIAAAPEMLAALETMLVEFGARLSDGKPIGYTVGSMSRALEMVKDAEAAIAKARGEASDAGR